MVSNAIGMPIRSPDPEQVARLFLPESCTDRAAFLDHNAGFVFTMDCEDAHRHLVDARDPDHGELSRMSLVQAYVIQPGSFATSVIEALGHDAESRYY